MTISEQRPMSCFLWPSGTFYCLPSWANKPLPWSQGFFHMFQSIIYFWIHNSPFHVKWPVWGDQEGSNRTIIPQPTTCAKEKCCFAGGILVIELICSGTEKHCQDMSNSTFFIACTLLAWAVCCSHWHLGFFFFTIIPSLIVLLICIVYCISCIVCC